VTTTNKIIGGLLILGNGCYFIPKTIKLLWTGGGAMGFGLLCIPLLVSLHAFLLTGLLAFLRRDVFRKISAFLFTLSLTLLFFGGLLSFFIPIIAVFTLVPTLLLAIFGITKYSERRLLLVNICGLLAMVNAIYFFWKT
jgi:hypothetical protein